jgi:nickel/cobalt exporter
MDLSLIYLPTAVALGALHALEPGHAKTLTAAYLIGTKGKGRDAILLGLSVAFTHSFVVVGLSIGAVLLGREAFTDEAIDFLAVGSSVVVIVLGFWLLSRRLRVLRKRGSHRHAHEEHDHQHDDADHDHSNDLPEYVRRGERPSVLQIIAFGAAGGLVPCPSAVSVMLLALSVSATGKGLILVLGFSAGLALTLVAVGLLVVSGVTTLTSTGRFSRWGRIAPTLAAALVILSGFFALGVALLGRGAAQ